MNTIFDLSEKNALITGGAGLLGVQHAIALGRSQANIYLVDIDDNNLNVALNQLSRQGIKNVFPIICDITSEEQVHTLFDKLIVKDVFIDILVNNAGIDHKVDSKSNLTNNTAFENFSLETWKRELAVTLDGTFLMSKYFGSEMARKSGGSIINIASDLSVIAPDNRIYNFEYYTGIIEKTKSKPISYSTSKTALIGITRYLAAYWAKEGVRVNAISPGGIFSNQDARFVELLINLIPMGRMAKIDEYHGAIVFLASNASAYLTGQNIIIDGGRTII